MKSVTGIRVLASLVLALLATVDASGTPVERVVNLLKDLKLKLDVDEKAEQQTYDKFACWCEKTTARKATSIDKLTTEIRAYGQQVLTEKGKVAVLASEIESLTIKVKENLAEQAKATSIRQKENAAFMAESMETKQAIVALQEAVTVLVEGTSLAQTSEQTTASLKRVLGSLPSQAVLKPKQVAKLEAFLQGGSQYMPQSFTVQGILTDMYRSFAGDLESATSAEANANKNFESFIAIKVKIQKQDEETKARKDVERAEHEELLTTAQQLYDDAKEQRAAEVAFFDETQKACLAKHDNWDLRSGLRTEEIAGIAKALEILTTDDARVLFATAIKEGKEVRAQDTYDTGVDVTPSFLQVKARGSGPALAAKAFAELKKQASATHSLRLAALAVRVREAKVGHFDQVIVTINDMINTLKQEDLDDIAKRDQCKEEFTKIESTVNQVTWQIKKNEAKINKLTELITLREQQKQETIDQIAEVDANLITLQQVRQGENREFLQAKSDDQDAIDALMEARGALSSFYRNHSVAMGPIQGSVKGLALAQEPDFEVSADQAPEAVFSPRDKRKNEAKGIVQLLTSIIEDLDDEIKNSMKSEEETQLEYEAQVAAAKKYRAELVDKKVSLEDAISKRVKEKSSEELDKQNNEASLQSEVEYKANIKNDCDWIIRTWEKRAAGRVAEMQGLEGAKEYLAAYKPDADDSSLIEKTKQVQFDDRVLSNTRFLGLR